MWLYTTDGFYSIVEDRFCKPGEVMVRGRNREDIERFKQKNNLRKAIIETQQADYHYRIPISKKKLAKYLEEYALNLRYSNFKNTIPHQEHTRHTAYYRCWQAMYDYQNSQ